MWRLKKSFWVVRSTALPKRPRTMPAIISHRLAMLSSGSNTFSARSIPSRRMSPLSSASGFLVEEPGHVERGIGQQFAPPQPDEQRVVLAFCTCRLGRLGYPRQRGDRLTQIGRIAAEPGGVVDYILAGRPGEQNAEKIVEVRAEHVLIGNVADMSRFAQLPSHHAIDLALFAEPRYPVSPVPQ